jgi:hypothetical protein
MKLIAVYFEEGDENQENQPNDQSVERTDWIGHREGTENEDVTNSIEDEDQFVLSKLASSFVLDYSLEEVIFPSFSNFLHDCDSLSFEYLFILEDGYCLHVFKHCNSW